MLVVKTSLKEFKGRGIGLVAKEPINKGTVVWTFNPVVDILINKKSIPKEALEFYDTYGVEYKKGKFALNTDNARFINHSKNPNTKSLGSFKDNIAIKNINPGGEITIDYSKIDVGGVNFKVVEK